MNSVAMNRNYWAPNSVAIHTKCPAKSPNFARHGHSHPSTGSLPVGADQRYGYQNSFPLSYLIAGQASPRIGHCRKRRTAVTPPNLTSWDVPQNRCWGSGRNRARYRARFLPEPQQRFWGTSHDVRFGGVTAVLRFRQWPIRGLAWPAIKYDSGKLFW